MGPDDVRLFALSFISGSAGCLVGFVLGWCAHRVRHNLKATAPAPTVHSVTTTDGGEVVPYRLTALPGGRDRG